MKTMTRKEFEEVLWDEFKNMKVHALSQHEVDALKKEKSKNLFPTEVIKKN